MRPFDTGGNRSVRNRLLTRFLLLGLTVAVAPVPAADAQGTSRAGLRGYVGRLLVASSRILDPRFKETVILMIEDGESGSLGLVVNKPATSIPLEELLSQVQGGSPTGGHPEITVHYGGPVQTDHVFVIHSPDVMPESSRLVVEGVALSADPEMLGLLGDLRAPRDYRVILGYAGWAAGQLENEIRGGSWILVDVDPSWVFSDNPEQLWQRIIDAKTMRM